ncbi:putative leucine-rich repeat-containing protein DDB_G0290503 isoform X2 [Euwallacea fornicatus]|uniref:putative leucine-rich repeat-containing protein DDB_G0290503 isoform X2 n=1 Tax=Euwallacea fornicatus TaxID=995702 RepID=UPI0033904F53
MDFYKKISANKSKESPGVFLSQKQCKCVSLQAITNTAIKDNNKKMLKELVEEINGHLADLRSFTDNSNQKYSDTRDRLIKEFEECLIKTVNSTSLNILNPVNAQLQELNNLTNVAIKENNYDQLQKLSERMERNITILKEIPEVKTARHSQNGDNKTLEVFNKYSSLLNKVRQYLDAIKLSAASEGHPEEKPVEDLTQPPQSGNAVVLNEVEEKLKLMRQKRLNRQSVLVNEQTKLMEKRSRENSPKNSGKNSETSSQLVISSSRENVKPFQYKAATIVAEKNQLRSEEKEKPKPVEKSELPLSKRELPSSNRGSYGQDEHTLIKSFAERQIENARNQQPSKRTIKHSNSSKTSPPRTPTQIRKIFNSFNCVQKSDVNHRSIEDLPSEFKSPFEQQLKNFQLKTTGFKEKFEVEKDASTDWRSRSISSSRSNSFKSSAKPEDGPIYENPPAIPPRNPVSATQKPEKSSVSIQKLVVFKRNDPQYHEEDGDENLVVKDVAKSVCIGQTAPTDLNTASRGSLHLDAHMISPQEASDVAITIRRDKTSAAVAPSSPERNSFSTFKSSNEWNKETVAVENPLYDFPVLKNEAITKETLKSLPEVVTTEIKPEVIKSEAKSSEFNTLDFIIGRRNRKPSYRRQLSNSTDHKFQMLQPDISKLEFAIQMYKGLKRDEDYLTLDKTLSKYYVKVNEVPASSSFDKMEKESLLERLNKAHKDLKKRVERNEDVMRRVLEEQVVMIGQKHGIA